MQTTSDRAAFPWLRPEFARLLAILWVVGLALVYLVRYGAGVLPWQAANLFGAALPALHIGPHFQEFWIARACDFVCVVGIVVAALGLGATVTYRLVAKSDIFGALLALAVGFWLLAALVLVAGSVSIAKIPLVCLALLCWFLPAPRKFVRDFQVSTDRTDGWAKLMIACIVLAAVLNLAGALAPPFEYDELEYHLGALADYQRAGRIVFLPHNFYSNLPQLTEMLYLLAKTMTSDIAAKMLHWLFGLLGALAVFGVARRLWSRAVGLTAAALFYCTPFVQDLGQTARIDLATAFFATLAFGALVIWNEDERRDLVWLSALCAGAAVATKWTAIPVVLLPLVILLAFRRKFRLLPVFGLLAMAVVAPWLVKNWLLTGNPARGTSTCVVSILPPRVARHFSGSEFGAVATNSVRPPAPPSMHANASVSTLIRSATSPPCFTRITSDMVGHATQIAFSASRQIPSGGLVPNSAHTRRFVSDPSAPISNAVKRAPNVSPAISVFASGVITIPFGNINSSATMRAAPSGATITSVVPRGVSPACRSNPKLPT